MSSQTDTFTVQVPLENVWKACEAAVTAMGWKVTSKLDFTSLVCKETMGSYLLYTMPAEIEIRLARVAPSGTQISLKGSNFGLGPIAGNHVKNHMTALRGRIESLSVNG